MFRTFTGADLSIGGKATSRQEWEKDPLKFMYVMEPIPTSDPRLQIQYSVQDTPGYGDGFDVEGQISSIVNFVIERQAIWKSYDDDKVPDQHRVECLIDACIYFVSPHRFKELDHLFMRALAKVVTVIPVVAKADSMTEPERRAYKTLIWRKVAWLCTKENDHTLIRSLEETERMLAQHADVREDLGLDDKYLADSHDRDLMVIMPFAVIASKDDLQQEFKKDEHWPARTYPWGIAESFNPDHCDFFFLKR